METSAKTGFNAKAIFIEAAKCLYNEHLKYKDRASKGMTGGAAMPQQSGGNRIPQPTKLSKTKIDEDNKKKGCC